MSTPDHLKPVEWSDLEAKDSGPRGLMNVVGVYQTEQSIATMLGMSGDRESPRYLVAQKNMAAAAEYLEIVHRVTPARLSELATEFAAIATQRSRSKRLQRDGVAVSTCRND